MKSLLPLIVCLLCVNPFVLNGQDDSELEEYFNEGQFFFNRGDYVDALGFYLKLVNADSTNANFNFKVGETYLNIPGKEHLAIPYFERSLSNIVPKQSYRKRSFEERAAPLHAYFYLGNAYRMNNELNKALEAYMKFTDSPYFHNNYNLNVVDREIQSCERAAIIRDAPLEFDKINLGSSVNSGFSEEKPVISGDGNTLAFIRRLQFYDAVFFSRKINGEWTKAINISPQIVSDGDFYPSGLSRDGRELILVRKEGNTFDLYASVFDGESWSKAEKLPGKLNTIFSETHASFGPDDNTLYITSDRKGGRGGFDIWVSRRDDEGSWSRMKNLGKQINTEVDDQIAYQSSDHDVLFFSSQGHYTMGGNDIFYSWQTGKKWKIPMNLGYPINDTRDNLNYCPDKQDCRQGYYVLTEDEGFGGSDIYLIKIRSESVLSFSDIGSEN